MKLNNNHSLTYSTCLYFSVASTPAPRHGYDIVVVLDSSVKPELYDRMKDYTKDFVNQISVDDDEYRMGLLRFSSDADVQFDLKDYGNKEDIFKAIDNIQYQEGGTTDVAKAFDKVRNDMFKQPKGDRDFARNYILLLTGNERSDDTNAAWAAAERAEDEGIGIYVVGIGVNDRTELDETSSHPLTTFQYLVGDEKELKDIPIKIQAAVLGCKYYLFMSPISWLDISFSDCPSVTYVSLSVIKDWMCNSSYILKGNSLKGYQYI